MVDDIHYSPRAERISFDMMVRFRFTSGRGAVWLRNLTRGGARIDGIPGLRVGDEITLTIPTLKPKPARVAWVMGGGAGLEFARPLHPDIFESLVLHYAHSRPRTDADRALQIDAPAPMPAEMPRHAA